MVTGEIRKRAGTEQRRFAIWDSRKGEGIHRWNVMWEGNPRIAKPGEAFDEKYENRGGARPYIVEKGWHKWTWRAYGPEPGEIFLTPLELAFAERAAGKIVVNPTVKDGASPNKLWPFARWQELTVKNPDLPWLQVGDAASPRLGGTVPFLHTPTFRDACGALYGARAAVLHEGGLHHAAAALGRTAVVIFGHFIAPTVTGYPCHRNLFFATKENPLGCGMRMACTTCRSVMESITPRDVARNLREVL